MTKAQFNRDEVIDNAINLFWQSGFNASSMKQVVNATGLQPGSIYLAFGNKEGLYKEALETYSKKSRQLLQKLLDSAPNVGEGICAIFEYFLQESLCENYASCFLIKSRLELAPDPGDLYEVANEQLIGVEEMFKLYLAKEYNEQTSSDRAACIMIHIFGLRVYGYKKDSLEAMRRSLHLSLNWLPWPPSV